jgi:putative flavoprotein involved in K+ transport
MNGRSARRPAGTVDVVVIGAGHSGLAMSALLTRRGIEHVVLERGEVANAWRTERWDSLRLLTPSWMTRLPGHGYDGADPDGYMRAGEVADFIGGYARQTSAPVLTRTEVSRVEPSGAGYRVATDRGDFFCRAVVLATGAFAQSVVPKVTEAIPAGVRQVTAHDYKNPTQLGPGGVLVVGASATGVQLAHEIARSGRPVTLAVGEHVRLPRVYRGRDIQWWMLASGVLDQRIEEVDDPARARRVASPQLVGTPERATLDLEVLQRQGVEIVGRLAGVRDGKAQFSGSLRNVCSLADLKMGRLLDAIDVWADQAGLGAEVGPAERYAPTPIAASPRLGLSLGSDVRTVVWATGFRPNYSWLHVPVFDRVGGLRHDRGVVDAPGLYVLGLPYLRRRKSSFIHGAEDDVRELVEHLSGYLDRCARSWDRSSAGSRSVLPLFDPLR